MSVNTIIHPGENWEPKNAPAHTPSRWRVGRLLLVVATGIAVAVLLFALQVQSAIAPEPTTTDAGATPIVLSGECSPYGALAACISGAASQQPPA